MEKLGRSGDSFIIGENTIIKVCHSNQGRFEKSFEKQMTFNSQFIKAVPIIKHEQINGKWHITMPYLKCDNSMIWISKASADEIDELVKNIIGYFENQIDESIVREFDSEAWNNKLNDLRSKIDDHILLEIIEWLESFRPANRLYYGKSHGDLTLTNLLISNDDGLEINAIDFLDVFVESIIMDICKWRQDTAHFWTLNIIENKTRIDMNRVKLLLSYIDTKIDQFMNKNEVLHEYYLPFQILNLMRILPYNINDPKIQNYLKDEIVKLYNARNNIDNSCCW